MLLHIADFHTLRIVNNKCQDAQASLSLCFSHATVGFTCIEAELKQYYYTSFPLNQIIVLADTSVNCGQMINTSYCNIKVHTY